MRRNILVTLLLLSIAACQSNDKKESVKNISKAKSISNKSNKSDSTTKKQQEKYLIGIWIDKDSENGNASFDIRKSTIYYPEHFASYKYKIIGDSVQIKYDDFTQSFAFTLKGTDTLILTGEDGLNIFYRVKK